MSGPWHLDEDLVEQYRTGRASPALSASLEQHVVGCAHCRALMTPALSPDRAARMWTGVLERVDTPPSRPVERALRRLGVSDPTARLLAATPSLQLSWLGGIALLLLLSLCAAWAGGQHGIAVFVALAPVLPVLGVAAAFAPRTDPIHEITAAAPYSAFRLLLVRSLAVVSVTVALEAVAAPLLPGDPWLAVAWLLPTLALTATTLSLSTSVDPVRAASGMVLFWALLTIPGLVTGHDPMFVIDPAVQLASLLVLIAAIGVLIARSDAVDAFPVPLRRNS